MLSPIATKSNPLDYSGERVVNGFIRPADGVSQGVVIGASGTLPLVTLSQDNPVRAMISHSGVLHAVCGGKLYSVSGGVATELADIPDGTTYMATSGTELAIIATEIYHLWDGTTLTTPDTGQVTTPRYIAHLDGFFVVAGADDEREDTFCVSDIYDGSTFQGLNFATAENAPDKITGAIADHGQLWLFGSTTTEVWYNSGDADFPFVPNAGAVVQQGCQAGTIAQLDNSLFWVTPENTVLRSGGGQPEVISTREIEVLLSGATIEGALAFFDKGHLIYAVRRAGATTLCYDVTTQVWHERAQGALNDAAWSGACAVSVEGTPHIGTSSGKVAQLDADTYTDDGEVLAIEVVASPITRGGTRFKIRRLYAQIQSGGVDISRTPKVLLQLSSDGKNWDDGSYRDLGDKGEYMTAVEWHSLGQFETVWARLRITDPVQRDIHGVAYE